MPRLEGVEELKDGQLGQRGRRIRPGWVRTAGQDRVKRADSGRHLSRSKQQVPGWESACWLLREALVVVLEAGAVGLREGEGCGTGRQ